VPNRLPPPFLIWRNQRRKRSRPISNCLPSLIGALTSDPIPKKVVETKELLRQLRENFDKKKYEYYTPEIKDQYKKNFRVFDRDQDNLIGVDEFKDLLISLSANMTEIAVLEGLYKLLETKSPAGKNGITFESFLIILSKELKEKDVKDDLKNAFMFFDQENNGWVPSEKFRELLMYNGYRYNAEQLDILMKEADPKNEGKIYYFDFIEKVTAREAPKKGKKKPVK